jgi:hypothetical protein
MFSAYVQRVFRVTGKDLSVAGEFPFEGMKSFPGSTEWQQSKTWTRSGAMPSIGLPCRRYTRPYPGRPQGSHPQGMPQRGNRGAAMVRARCRDSPLPFFRSPLSPQAHCLTAAHRRWTDDKRPERVPKRGQFIQFERRKPCIPLPCVPSPCVPLPWTACGAPVRVA